MNKRKLNILVVCGFFPYPPMHGGMIDVWKRIQGIKELGHTIDLVYTVKEKPAKEEVNFVKQYVRNLFEVSRKNRVKDIFSKIPIQVASRNQLKNISINHYYDYVILEGDYVGQFIKNSSVSFQKLIIRSHNDEAWYFKNLCKSTSNVLKKAYYRLESIKFKGYTNSIYAKANRIWYISKDEAHKSNFINKKKTVHMPPPFALEEIKKQELKLKNVLFIGSLFMDNNIEGIVWYLKNVHYQIMEHEKNYMLIIVGSSGDKEEKRIKELFKKHSNIELYLDAPSLQDFYKKASVFINPMLHGAGVKIKSIESIINGLPLISTSVGIEGTGLNPNKDFFLANDRETFVSSVLLLLRENRRGQKMVENAQRSLKENHYLKLLKQELNAITKNI